MKLTVEIPDNKADFMLELLNSLPYVKVLQDRKAQKAAAKAASIAEMKEAILELNEVLAGRRESRSVYDFLKEVEADGI
jgi:hypothetical protein